MTAAQSTVATFNVVPLGYALTLIKAGPGSGTVFSSPAGINCGGTCSANFSAGTFVNLIASASTGSTFGGWSGACTGTSTVCLLSMAAAKSVIATFNGVASSYVLSVSKGGAGSGTVTSTPAGINCGAACSASFGSGSTVTLDATAAAGSSFAGWSGACAGATVTCVVTMSAAQSVTAAFSSVSVSYVLTVGKLGAGSGTVSSTPAGINCGVTCSASFGSGTSVTLIATAAAGSSFAGWSGGCAGASATCVVSMAAAQSVSASFGTAGSNYALVIGKSGTGSGTVLSSPSGLNCGTTCSALFAPGTSVTLIASLGAGSTFGGWTGDCVGSGTLCTVSMTAARSVTATFNGIGTTNYALTLFKTGTGGGTVTSVPSGISCGASCAANFSSGTAVTLTASASAGSGFTGWSGACSGTALTCVVTMNAAQSVTASFGLVSSSYALTVAKAGAGIGTVNSAPSGITCGATCSASFGASTTVTLTAQPAAGSAFAGWAGACVGASTSCVVVMTAAQSVTASFVPATVRYNLTALRSGSGTVVSSPPGISCGSVCNAAFDAGSTVTLTPTASPGWTFSGWSGACTGSASTCSLSITGPKAALAIFTLGGLGVAVDNATLPWTSLGRAQWYAQSNIFLNGGSAAQSGTILHNSFSVIQTTVTGPGTLRFYWKVSSEGGFDYLAFQYDGWDQVAISGEIGWELQEWFVPEGNHVLSWVFSKDDSLNVGADAGWLDTVSFSPGTSTAGTQIPVASPAAIIRRGTAVGASALKSKP